MAWEELELTMQQDGVILTVWVQTRSSRDEISGVQGGMLRIHLTAPPVNGAANKALVRLLARRLRIPQRDVSIVHGHRSRRKRIKVYGLSAEKLRARLG